MHQENDIEIKVYPRMWWAALLFHILFPGLGQFYNGKIKRAIYFFVAYHLMFFFWMSVVYFTESMSGLVLMVIMAVAVWIYGLVDAILLSLRIKGSYQPNKYNDKWHKYAIVIMLMFLVSELSGQFSDTKIIEAYRMPSGSMEDTILVGDYIIVKKCDVIDLKVGDIVVFQYPRDPSVNYLKRIVASEGQK
ncbi:MAG: signal peptidase I, partial [candidate division Zixibacteria bacterium]|nr:signal peptidase I [candidate division Zixibacteria bacterium]